MPIYIFAGPAVALIGIISVFFVLRHKSVEKRSMYSSRRSNLERKVKAARQRTLAPRGRGGKAPTDAEIAAATPMTAAPAYEAPRTQSWDMPAAPAPVYEPPAAAPAPAYEPPPVAPGPAYEPPPPAPFAPAEPSTPAPSQPEWTPAPAEAVWTPAPSADIPRPREAQPAAPQAVTSAGGGAAWSIVGDARPGEEAAPKVKDKDKGKKKDKAAGGSPWELASGVAPGDDADDEPKKPSAAMALAQYAVLVVGLVMVLIGVLVMVANSKVT
jgi:hypothetical protein